MRIDSLQLRKENISPLEISDLIHNFKLCADALGYISAENVHATHPLPPFPASIKDGYAVLGTY